MNLAEAKISIVIPAYNAEQSIDKCVRSLQRQIHSALEIIVVDDHSSDSTGEIVRKLGCLDPRIRYVRAPQNVGVHGARRLGVSASTGKLMGFVDADDYVEPTMYSTLLRRMVETDASIVICSASLVSKGKVIGRRIGIKSRVIDSDVLGAYCRHKLGSGVLWNKLYRREVIEGPVLADLDVAYSEDYIVNFGAFANASKVALCSDPLYNWVAHSSNASGHAPWPAFASVFRGYVACLEQYAKLDPRFPPLVDELFLRQLHWYRVDHAVPPDEVQESLAQSLRRLADANPASIHRVVASLPTWHARAEKAVGALTRWLN